MKATILIDNIAEEGLLGEWGLSIYIEYNGRKLLLDTGASGKFMVNAKQLRLNMKAVEYGILSHAHYDHADGMGSFFAENGKAPFYLREGSGENCYKLKFFSKRYIGIKKGTLSEYADRIVFVKGKAEICPGAVLIPHSAKGLAAVGRKNHMYVRRRMWHADDFSHEQSLVLETCKGLAVFNSCCHAGADTIIREVLDAFPGKKVHAVIGGFHLHEKNEAQVRALAGRIRETGVEKIYTGHCTGGKACCVLEEELGGMAERLYTGKTISITA